MSTCYFIGYRNAPEELRPLLAEAVERHVTEYGVTDFVAGHYGRFGAMAASSVRAVKKRHPEVTLTLLLPYNSFRRQEELSKDYDASFFPPDMESVPKPFAIVRANEYMIHSSDYLICYAKGQVGKTRDFVELAQKREEKGLIHIENLAEML